ncbi:hypothetical protein [Dokdonella fugitiva]|uniref:Transglutaminase superfamily protein n=1 Tax=Dokdonella fugitiva TaxID=328517 RepID=A0A4R2IET3_9GAMM|nr:hypothetical protein [Dokdonella fugitiva]TCO41165.1 hypothetical protein EV148_10384 [Dokdonella fugitiva]
MRPLATAPHWRPSRLLAVAGALALASAAGVAHAFDWQVEVTPAGELFPALQLSQSPRPRAGGFGDGDGLVSVSLRGSDLPRHLRLRIDTPGLRRPVVLEADVEAGAHRVDLHPRLEWDMAWLRTLDATREQPLRLSLEADGVTRTHRVDVRVHALFDAPYYVREGRDRVDLGWAFAGYVDPRDPVVDEILADARRADAGFDRGSDLHRVAAIWAALERRGVAYDAGDPALSRGPVVWSQRVRLPAAVWRDRRANCIDSSVLIAAVLERLGMRALIVLVPGHAFVGYRDRDRAEYFETTLLGARHGRAAADPAANFAAARAAGGARWRRVAARLDGRHGPDYALIDIGTARAYGIIPLGAGERASRHPSEATPAPAGSSRQRGLP